MDKINQFSRSLSFKRANQNAINVIDEENIDLEFIQQQRKQSQHQSAVIRKAKNLLMERVYQIDLKENPDITEIQKERMLLQFRQKVILDKEVATFFLASVNYSDLDDAVGYIIKMNMNGKLVHPYVQGLENKCYICQSTENKHQESLKPNEESKTAVHKSQFEVTGNNTVTQDQLFLDQAQNSLEKKKTSFYRKETMKIKQCELCWEDLKPDEEKFSFICLEKHTFHKECIKDSFTDFIKRGEIKNLKCPVGCENSKASNDEINDIFVNQDDLRKRYGMLRDKLDLESDPLMRYCPQPKCEGIIRAKNKDDKELQCPDCNKSLCFQCKNIWHPDTTCYLNQVEIMKNLGQGDLSFCPVCHVKIERTQGCNKMSCASCGNSWCWLCGVSIKGYTHFRGDGCGATIFSAGREPAVEERPQNINRCTCTLGEFLLNVMKFIAVLIIGVVFAWVAPAIVLCSPLIGLFYLMRHFCCKGCYVDECLKVWAGVMILFAGLTMYYEIYTNWYTIKWFYMNIGFYVLYLICVLYIFVDNCREEYHVPATRENRKEQLDKEEREVREQAEKRRDGIIKGDIAMYDGAQVEI